MYRYQVAERMRELQQELYYKDQVILKYTIKYPQFISGSFELFLDKLNNYYYTRALMYEKKNVMDLFQMAIVDYENSIVNNYPIRMYEVYVDYEVTYNQNCALSLYFDQYEYTGGAHGLTVRSSDNWNLKRSREIKLNEVIVGQINPKVFIIENVLRQIDQSKKEEDFLYFDDYDKLVRENLKNQDFYLSDDGVVIYFQQYAIAPYASGLRTFLIPYSLADVEPPTCKQ